MRSDQVLGHGESFLRNMGRGRTQGADGNGSMVLASTHLVEPGSGIVIGST